MGLVARLLELIMHDYNRSALRMDSEAPLIKSELHQAPWISGVDTAKTSPVNVYRYNLF